MAQSEGRDETFQEELRALKDRAQGSTDEVLSSL